MYPLGDRGGLCVAQHGSFNWEKPGLHFFLNVPCVYTMRGNMAYGSSYYGSLSLDGCLEAC